MISFDTNLLLYRSTRICPEYVRARAFFDSLPAAPGEVAICELVRIELYVLLRNPAVLKQPSMQRMRRPGADVSPASGVETQRLSGREFHGDGRSVADGGAAEYRASHWV
jgi:hypothetical protein